MAESAKGFWATIGLTILGGIAWMIGSEKLIDWIMKRDSRVN